MSAPIRVAIRANAGAALGTGHFARASAVAEALWAGEACEVVLVTTEEGAALVPAYFPADANVLTLEAAAASPAEVLRALGAKGWSPEVVYLDHYGDVREWEAQAAKSGVRLLVLDDLNEARNADVIVRPHGEAGEEAEGVVLRGPAYLPLSPHLSTMAPLQTPLSASKARLRLNVCFGGSDPTGETEKALQALTALETLDADVVIGPGARIDEHWVKTAMALPHISVRRAPSQRQMAELLRKADFALGAGGVMLWERLCLGVPSLVVQVAKNQQSQIEATAAVGAIRFVGDHTEVSPTTMAEAIVTLAIDQPARASLAYAGRKLVDGRGAWRLASWTRALALRVRDVRPADAEDIFGWRTDARTWQHNWVVAEKPDFQAHVAWLKTRLADPACVFRIVSREEQPVGVARFDIDEAGRSASLSIYLVPAWHGHKMGLAVYLAAERALRLSHPRVREITSRIHRENSASQQLHSDAGFTIVASTEREDWLDARKSID